MPVCIVGMHRSGTSFITHLMQHGGLYLGDDADLMPPGPDNPDGFFEHRRFFGINERLLHRFGGDWDVPTVLVPGWTDDPGLAPLRDEARLLADEMAIHEPWGWKDPRSSVTLPFWQQVVPELKLILCVRNPLEVAISLNRRNQTSYELGLHLWQEYTERILDAIAGHKYLVVHYEKCLADPAAELDRLAAFAGVHLTDEARANAMSIARAPLRHSSFSFQQLLDSRTPHHIVELYRRLCGEAGWTPDPGRAETATATTDATDATENSLDDQPSVPERADDEPGSSMTVYEDRTLRRSVIELELLRRDMTRIQESEAHHKALAEKLQEQLTEVEQRIGRALAERDTEIERRDVRILRLQAEKDIEISQRDARILRMQSENEAEIDKRDAQIAQLQAEHDEWRPWIDQLKGDLEQRDARLLELQAEHDEWRGWIERLQAEVAQRDARILEVQAEHEAWRGWIEQLQAEIEQRDTRIVTLQTEHDEWRGWIVKLQEEIQRRDELIGVLRQEMGRRA